MALNNDFKVKNGLTVTDSISAGGNLSASEGFFDGDVGIGTNSPASELHVEGTNDPNLLITRAGVNKVLLGDSGTNNGGDLLLYNADGTLKTLIRSGASSYLNGGNVGIGTTSPIAKFEVTDGSSSITLQEYSSGAAIFLDGVNGDFTGGDYFHILANSNSYLGLGGYGGGTTPLNISNVGKVGIGTTSPSSPLHISGSDNVLARFHSTDASATLYLSDNSTSNFSTFKRVSDNLAILENGGNVGIGDSTPSYKLDVAGDINSQSNILSGGVDLSSIFGSGGGSGTVTSVTAGAGMTQTGVSTVNPTLNVVGALSGGICVTADAVCVDSTVVRTSGNQTIAGAKSFSDDICIAGGIRHTGDTNTFIKFLYDDAIFFRAGNCDNLRILTTGVVFNEFSKDLDFRVEGDTDTHALFVEGSSSNVGIGCSHPSAKLTVAGDSLVTGNSTIYGNLSVTGDFTCIETTISTTSALSVTNTGTGPALFVCQAGVQPVAHFIDANGGDVVIADDGKVGIGTFSPGEKLEVYDGDIKLNDGSRNLIIGEEGSGSYQLKSSGALVIDATTAIQLNKTTSGNVTIASGNVGIGTTSPARSLHLYSSANNYIRLQTATVNGYSGVEFANDAQTWTLGVINNDTFALSNAAQFGGGYPFQIEKNALNNSFIVKTSGNVGIGTTSPAQKLDVSGKIAVNGQTAVYIPLGNFTGSSFYGDGGGSLSYVSGNDGGENTGVGIGALFSNTTGNANTASGTEALFSNTTGAANVASGYQSLYSNISGDHNIASGRRSLYSNTAGACNIASGRDSLGSNTTGGGNIASGYRALRFNTTGNYNVASGYQSLYSNISGDHNVTSGYQSLFGNTTGSNNVAIGDLAGRYIANGSTANQTSGTSVYLGKGTKALADGGANEIVIGYDAIGNGSNTTTIGNSSITDAYICGDTNMDNLTVTGDVSASGNGYFACVIAGGYFEAQAASPELAEYPTGSLVVLDSVGGLKLSDTENDNKVFGITQQGAQQPIILGAEPILITGDVGVGDFIVTSNVQGHGMSSACTQHGTVIAQAMEGGSGCSYLIKAMIRKM